MDAESTDSFVAYPMVEEHEATGVVAGVYAELLTTTPFVPSLFKSLALCPGYLVLAHEQVGPALRDDTFAALAGQLADSVRDAAAPPADPAVRQALAGFLAPLSRMTLLAAGLRRALAGDLDVPPAPGQPPAARPVHPEQPAPSPQDAPAPGVYGGIRAALQSPIVNSVWRALARDGQLAVAWAALGPQVADTRPAADALQQRAWAAAARVPWQVGATPAALAAAGLTDAAPGMARVLDAYLTTLPRVLALVGGCAAGDR